MTVAVVGAGFAGLFTARALLEAGTDDVVVLEASDRPGGVTRSVVRDGYTLEPGAGSFLLPHPYLSRFVDDARPAAPTASTRYVWTGRRLVELRRGPAALAAPVVGPTAKLRGLAEAFVPEPSGDGDEPLEAMLRRRLGDELGRLVAWLAASGVYAGDPLSLSARHALPAMTALLEAHGSFVKGAATRLRRPPAVRPSTHVPTKTMQRVADGLAEHLGDRLRTGFAVERVAPDHAGWLVEGSDPIRASQVVLACNPAAAVRLLGPSALRSTLEEAEVAPVVVVGLGGADLEVPSGFGILAGPDAATFTRGAMCESSYAPHRAPGGHGLVKVIAGGEPRSPLSDADDDTIVATVGGELARMLGRDVSVSFTEVVRREIPQYRVGHGAWLAALDAATPPGLHLTGWGYRGVGIGHVAADAARVAARIAA